MDFRVSATSFCRAVDTLAPFVDKYPAHARPEIVLELRGDHGYLVAERAGHTVRAPFCLQGGTRDLAVSLPFRVASSVSGITEEGGPGRAPATVAMRIEERAVGAVFSYAAAGASWETAVRLLDRAARAPLGVDDVPLGAVDPIVFRRALGIAADALASPGLEESRRLVAFAMYEGVPAALAATAHERVVAEGAGLVAGLRVHLSTVPLLLSFLRKAPGPVVVTASATHARLTDACDQSFSFPQVAAGARKGHASPPIDAGDVVLRVDVEALVTALGFLTRDRRPDLSASAALKDDGTLYLNVRTAEREESEVSIATSFVSAPRGLAFRLSPHALLRLLRSHEGATVELRLTTGGMRPDRAARLLSTTETILDGALRVHRIAALTV
jgi:hypothetical protein